MSLTEFYQSISADDETGASKFVMKMFESLEEESIEHD
jgi:hypothetical protein